jgi:hypothetical protein
MRARLPVSLNVIHVDKPCPADWDAMHGDDRVRFCDECRLHVYNLSELTRGQAERLVAQHEGRLCVRYYKRADGTIITQDCGGGIRRAMQRTRRVVTAVAGALVGALLTPLGLASMSRSTKPDLEQNDSQQSQMQGKLAVMGGSSLPPPVMGIVAPRPPATQPATQPAECPSTQPSDE